MLFIQVPGKDEQRIDDQRETKYAPEYNAMAMS